MTREINKLRGVRGWLVWMIVSMMIIGPLWSIAVVNSNFVKTESYFPQLVFDQTYSNYKMWSWTAVLIYDVVFIYAGYKLWKDQKPDSVQLAIWVLWAVPIAGLVTSLVIDYGHYPNLISGQTIFEYAKSFVGSFISAGIWTAYLKKSVRVKNTYFSGFGSELRLTSVSAQNLHNLNDIDSTLWKQISDEFSSSNRIDWLWSKCIAVSDGDESKAKALYLRERVMELSKVVNSSIIKNSRNGSATTNQVASTSESGKKQGWLLIALLVLPLLLIWALVPGPSTNKKSADDLDELARRYGGVPVTPQRDQFGGIPVEKGKTSREVPKEDLPWNQNWKSK